LGSGAVVGGSGVHGGSQTVGVGVGDRVGVGAGVGSAVGGVVGSGVAVNSTVGWLVGDAIATSMGVAGAGVTTASVVQPTGTSRASANSRAVAGSRAKYERLDIWSWRSYNGRGRW